MKSVGDTLRLARERKKISLAQIADQTHVRLEYLLAIEQNTFEVLPSEVAARGFIRLFAEMVGLDPVTILALYRRDATVAPGEAAPSLRLRPLLIQSKRRWKLAGTVGFAGVCMGLLLYAGIVLYRLSQAPRLTVSSPKSEASVISPFIIKGSTLSDAVVQIDGEAVGVNQDGQFVKEVTLFPGPHVLTIKAIGRNGKENISSLSVTVIEEK